MSKTLITGGAGFVGNNLARLIKPCVILDWREPDYLFGGDGGVVFDDCEYVNGDIRRMEDLDSCGDVDTIVHLAAIPE